MERKYKYSTPIKSKDKNGNYIVQVRVNGVRYKQRISTKLSNKEQEINAIALVDLWSEMLKQDFSPFDDEDFLKFDGKYGEPLIKNKVEEYLFGITEDNTRQSYSGKLNVLVKKYGNKKVKEIQRKDIEELLKDEVNSGNYAQSTLEHAKKILRMFFRWCVSEGIIEESPIIEISKSIKGKKDVEDANVPFSDEHFKMIMEELKKPENKLYYQYTAFLYQSHIRPNEIRKLIKKDIDIKNKVITIRSTTAKYDKKEHLPIFPALAKVIEEMNLNELDDNDFIFYLELKNGKRNQISKSYVSDRFREKILKPLGLYEGTGYNFYSFKAKATLDKLNLGWTLPQLQKINRHSNVGQTLTYLKNISKITEIDNLPTTDF